MHRDLALAKQATNVRKIETLNSISYFGNVPCDGTIDANYNKRTKTYTIIITKGSINPCDEDELVQVYPQNKQAIFELLKKSYAEYLKEVSENSTAEK